MSTQTQAYVPYAVLLKQHEEAQKLKKVLATHVTGTVKWFSLRYHYGFIARDNETPDVFVHQMSIIKSRMKRVYLRSLAHGEKVEFDVVEGKIGPEASNVTGPGGADVQGVYIFGSRYPLRPLSRRRRDSQDNIKPNRRERRHTENSDGSKSLTSSESRTRCRSENDGNSQEIKDPSLQQPQKAQRKNKRHRNRRHQTRTDSEIKAETPEKETVNVLDDVDAPNSQPANKSEKKSEAINGKTKKKGANKAVELEDEKANTDGAKADKPKVATPNNKAGDDEASKSEVDVAKTQKNAPTKAEVVNGKINKEGADKPVESEDAVVKTNNKAADGEASKPETDVAKADIDAINNFTKSEANCVFYKKNKKNVNKAAEVVDDKVNNKATDDAKADKPDVVTPNNKAGDGEASKPEVDVAKTQKDAPTKADKSEVVNGKTNKKDANKPELDDEDDKDNAIVDDATKREIDVVEVNKDASSKVVKTEVVNGKNNNKATAGETDKVVQPEVVNGKPKYNKIAAFVQAFEKAK